MGRRRYHRTSWWRWNPEGEELPKVSPLPEAQEDFESYLIDLGQQVPPSVDEEELPDLDLPPDEDDEIGHISFSEVRRPRRGRPKGSKNKPRAAAAPSASLKNRGSYHCGACGEFGHNARTCSQSKSKKKGSKKVSSKPVKKQAKSKKTLSKAQALKIVAKYAGKRGRRQPDYSAALKVLCGRRKRNRRG